MEPKIVNLFPTPLLRASIGDAASLNAELAAMVSRLAAGDTDRGAYTIRGGFHSKPTLFQTQEPAIATLRDFIVARFRDFMPTLVSGETALPSGTSRRRFELWGWAVAIDGAGSGVPHLHARSSVSGVYYVSSARGVDLDVGFGRGDRPGWIAFCDPRSQSQMWPWPDQLTAVSAAPIPGTMLMFPSYLQHFIAGFDGGGERISIAFNIRLLGDDRVGAIFQPTPGAFLFEA